MESCTDRNGWRSSGYSDGYSFIRHVSCLQTECCCVFACGNYICHFDFPFLSDTTGLWSLDSVMFSHSLQVSITRLRKRSTHEKCINNMKRFIFVCVKAYVYCVTSMELGSCHTQIAAVHSELCCVKYNFREK